MSKCKLCELGIGMMEGHSQREVAKMHGISKSSVGRHRAHYGVASAPSTVFDKYGVDRSEFSVRSLTIKEEDGSYVRLAHEKGPRSDAEHVDPTGVLEGLVRAPQGAQGGQSVFVVSLNDWQVGKAEGGGTPALVDRLNRSVNAALARIEELRKIGRDLGTLIIIGGGDIIEACSIYPNQAFSIDLTQSEQMETALTMILWTIDQLASGFEDVIVLATKGNHGENRINGAKTAPRDNNDTLLFKMAKMATDRDPNLSHVRYVICDPEEESATVAVPGTPWVLGTTHGDVFGKFGKGQTKMLKAWDWYKNMAAGRFPVGNSDVLVTHHFHHYERTDWGSCMWVQTPAQDGGSAYFEQFAGQYSAPGMLSFVMTPTNRYQDEAIL